jgi:hypothetical protein
MKRTFACALLFFAPIWAQEKKPDFSGRWSINAARSDYGRMPKPKTYVEVIEQKEPVFTVSTTSEDGRGESTMFLKLTTDDRDCVNEVNGNEFHSKSHWEGAKLVTTVTGDRGLSLVEVRSLSADGKTQTVETYMGQRSGTPAMVRVEERK